MIWCHDIKPIGLANGKGRQQNNRTCIKNFSSEWKTVVQPSFIQTIHTDEWTQWCSSSRMHDHEHRETIGANTRQQRLKCNTVSYWLCCWWHWCNPPASISRPGARLNNWHHLPDRYRLERFVDGRIAQHPEIFTHSGPHHGELMEWSQWIKEDAFGQVSTGRQAGRHCHAFTTKEQKKIHHGPRKMTRWILLHERSIFHLKHCDRKLFPSKKSNL